MKRFDPSSRSVLTARDLPRFPGETLFARVARALCEAECVPRKELYESWEVARRVRRRFRGGRAVDLACGHALLAHLLLVLDDTSAEAVAVDLKLPPSAARAAAALCARWPRLAGRVKLVEAPLDAVPLGRGDLVVSAHACGALTDDVLRLAARAQCRVAVLPCCHDEDHCDAAGLEGWMDPALAIDAARAVELRRAGYSVHTQTIPAQITPKNRLLLAAPLREAYEATRYDVHLPGGKVSLRAGLPAPPEIEALLEGAQPTWAFVTAWNPGSRRLSRRENQRRQRELIRRLSGRYRLYPGEGASDAGDWPGELSVLALGIPPSEAVELGRAFGQQAVLVGARGEPARVVFCAERAGAQL